MDNHDKKKLNQRITDESRKFSKTHRLDEKRVTKVFHRLAYSNWILPDDTLATEFETAFFYMNPAEAIELFEKEDLTCLAARTLLVDYLNDKRIPLYSLNKLAELTDDFISHLEENRDHLIRTGFPKAKYYKSLWLDIHFNNLYYTKLPLLTCKSCKSAECEQSSICCFIDDYIYTWVKEAINNKFCIQIFRGCHSNKMTNFYDVRIRADLLFDYSGDFTPCDYEEASLISWFEGIDLIKLEHIRLKVYDLRINILRRLNIAVRDKSARSLIDDCVKLISKFLTIEEIFYLYNLDQRYSKMLYGDLASNPFKIKSLYYHNSGLSDLFKVIGHYYKEIQLSTMDITYKSIQELPYKKLPVSYYESVGKAWQEDLNQFLFFFAVLEEREKEFWPEFRNQVYQKLEFNMHRNVWFGLDGRSSTEIDTIILSTGTIERSQLKFDTETFRAALQGIIEKIDDTTLEEILNEVLKSDVKVPQKINAKDTLKKGVSKQIFKKRNGFWHIVYEDEDSIDKDSMGLKHIYNLIKNPNKPFYALQLYLLSKGTLTPVTDIKNLVYDDPSVNVDATSSNQEVFDEKARNQIVARINEINDELNNKDSISPEERNELKREKGQLHDYLNKAQGLGGRSRTYTDDEIRKRSTVAKAINRSLKKIENKMPKLYKHLKHHISTGPRFVYNIEKPIPWKL